MTENILSDITENVNDEGNTSKQVVKEEVQEEISQVSQSNTTKTVSEKEDKPNTEPSTVTDSDVEVEIVKNTNENRKSTLQPIAENELLTDITLKSIKQDDVTNVSIDPYDESTHRIRKNRSLMNVLKRNKKGKKTHQKTGSIASESSSVITSSTVSQSGASGKKKKKSFMRILKI